MSDQISIDSDALRAHARKVAQLADDVSTATNAIASINLSGGAFGLMCAWMVAPATVASNIVGSHIKETRSVLDRTSGAVSDTARTFDASEEQIIDAITQLDRAL